MRPNNKVAMMGDLRVCILCDVVQWEWACLRGGARNRLEFMGVTKTAANPPVPAKWQSWHGVKIITVSK
jgi:hypothetical protein